MQDVMGSVKPEECIEPAPGNQLKAMMRRIDQDMWKKVKGC